MKSGEIIREIMVDRRLTQTRLAELAGYARQSSVRDVIFRENGMSVKNMLKLLHSMGAKVVVRYDDQEWEVTTDENQT